MCDRINAIAVEPPTSETLSRIEEAAYAVTEACRSGSRLELADAIGAARREFGVWEIELRDGLRNQ